MRVLVVPKWYPWPELPVFGQFCREHARALATEHDVVVLASLFTPDADFPVYRLMDQEEDGLRTLRVRYRRPRLRPLALVCQVVGFLAAVRRLRRSGWRPDVVHAHVWSAALPALVLGRLFRAPVVVTEHYTGFARGQVTGVDARLARFAFEHADLVAPVSHDLEETLRAVAPRAHMEVVRNVVDTDAFSPPDAPHPAGRSLLNVAALAEKKGHRFLLEALTRLPDARLEVIGDGELRADLERLAADLGVADRVAFLGERPKEEVAERMRAADVFVLPSLFETFGVVLIEAAASGLPAVATRIGGVIEAVTDETAVLVAPGDPDALAKGVEQALARDFDAQAMATATRERYAYPAFARRWTELYSELPSRRGRSSEATRSRVASSE